MATDLPTRQKRQTILRVFVAFALLSGIATPARVIAETGFACEPGATLATGRPDPQLFAADASKGIRAHWCERYDENGHAIRTGPYWETYSNGHTRSEARYVDSRLEGPVSIHNDDGSLFLRGFLDSGDWSGPLEMFHESGAIWFEAQFDAGRLEGELRTRFPDGALESETRFQAGREDGLARSFYATAAGGRLKSEAHVEGDQLVGQHRVLDPDGRLRKRIDWNTGPLAWDRVATQPAAPDFAPRDTTQTPRELDLHD